MTRQVFAPIDAGPLALEQAVLAVRLAVVGSWPIRLASQSPAVGAGHDHLPAAGAPARFL